MPTSQNQNEAARHRLLVLERRRCAARARCAVVVRGPQSSISAQIL